MSKRVVPVLTALMCGSMLAGLIASSGESKAFRSLDATGWLQTVDVHGDIDRNNLFFQDLGSNGRTCGTCHVPEQAWSFTPEAAQARFLESHGLDPLFRTNDGSVCEDADVSTMAKRQTAFGLLLTRGLIRVSLDVPTQTNDAPPKPAEFDIVAVDDPYHCAASQFLPLQAASLFRRPLPSTNLSFLTAVMWDGREPSLAQQANDATLGHAQAGVPLTLAQQAAIVDFESGLYTAQSRDNDAGSLNAKGASGGATALAAQQFYTGINDPIGFNPTSAPFTPEVFTIFTAWRSIAKAGGAGETGRDDGPRATARRSIARGEELFNTKPIVIAGVGGLNNETFSTPSGPVTVPGSFVGSCTTCHDAPNVGDHSVKAPLNIGVADAARRTRDMPLYTLRNLLTNETAQTTDPGRAMITGKWADIGKFKGPILRGLAARAPYFHNGSAGTLDDVVEFYDSRFNIGFTKKERSDLVAFLGSL